MAVRRRVDSIQELNARKTTQQLAEENETLKQQVAFLEEDLVNTQLALVEVYELILGGES